MRGLQAAGWTRRRFLGGLTLAGTAGRLGPPPSSAPDPPFHGWDTGPHKTPYCCSLHWFRLADGRIVGLDLIRSDDTDQLGLRAYLVEADGAIQGLAYTAPTAQWAPFASESAPPLGGPKPALGRGLNWVAGSLHTGGQPLNRVAFELTVVPQSKAYNYAALWQLEFVYLTATDFTTVQTTGWLEIDGIRHAIDSEGPVSVHYGAHLPSYAYGVTVHDRSNPEAPRILLASVAGDNFRGFGQQLKALAVTYAYGGGGVPPRLYHIGPFEPRSIPVGFTGEIELAEIQPFTHQLLGVETITATAMATLHLPLSQAIALGRVMLDYRGSVYTQTLT
jgi:hypothetical protein